MRDPTTRRPGEALFAVLMLAGSAALLWSAHGIAGFEALSSPGALPLAATATMLTMAGVITWGTLRRPRAQGETVVADVLPGAVVFTVVLLGAYALLLQPLGFLPTSFLFVLVLVRVLGRRGLPFCAAVALGSVLGIYLVFRVVFGVLMPEGIVPEREILAWLGGLLRGGR
jgi:hypothetical protein